MADGTPAAPGPVRRNRCAGDGSRRRPRTGGNEVERDRRRGRAVRRQAWVSRRNRIKGQRRLRQNVPVPPRLLGVVIARKHQSAFAHRTVERHQQAGGPPRQSGRPAPAPSAPPAAPAAKRTCFAGDQGSRSRRGPQSGCHRPTARRGRASGGRWFPPPAGRWRERPAAIPRPLSALPLQKLRPGSPGRQKVVRPWAWRRHPVRRQDRLAPRGRPSGRPGRRRRQTPRSGHVQRLAHRRRNIGRGTQGYIQGFQNLRDFRHAIQKGRQCCGRAG